LLLQLTAFGEGKRREKRKVALVKYSLEQDAELMIHSFFKLQERLGKARDMQSKLE